MHGKSLLIVLVTYVLPKYRYHLNGLNKASRAGRHMYDIIRACAAIQETTTTMYIQPSLLCTILFMVSRVSEF